MGDSSVNQCVHIIGGSNVDYKKWLFLKRNGSNQLRNPTRHQAQNNGGGERQKELPPKEGKAQVTGQAAEAEFFEPRGESADQEQREEDDDEPADHGSEGVRAVALCEADGFPRFALVEANDLE